jgi:hypothetical protein
MYHCVLSVFTVAEVCQHVLLGAVRCGGAASLRGWGRNDSRSVGRHCSAWMYPMCGRWFYLEVVFLEVGSPSSRMAVSFTLITLIIPLRSACCLSVS